MATMLAGRLNVATRRFAVESVEVPVPGPGQVRVKVAAAGICLSDVHLIDGSLKPMFLAGDVVTLGHEVAGTIDAVGERVPPRWKAGQRVLLHAGEVCGVCRHCASGLRPCLQIRTRGVDYDGGWAEYCLASSTTLVELPPDLPFQQAAIIPDAVSTPWAAITASAQLRAGQSAGVWGVGGLGAHAVQLLRLAGAAPIIAVDPLEVARSRALELGADVALDPSARDLRERILVETEGRGLAFAFDFAGVPAVRGQASRCLAVGGRLVLVGMAPGPVTVDNGLQFNHRQQQLVGHYGSEPEHIVELVALARRHRLQLSRSVSQVLPLRDAARGVEWLQRREVNAIRLVLEP